MAARLAPQIPLPHQAQQGPSPPDADFPTSGQERTRPIRGQMWRDPAPVIEQLAAEPTREPIMLVA